MKWLGLGAIGGFAAVTLLLGLPLLAVAGAAPSSGTVDPAKVPAPYVVPIEEATAACDGVPAAVLAAQLHQESQWNVAAVSPDGAMGLAQFLPSTWALYGVDGDRNGTADPWNGVDAIWSAALYDCALKRMVAQVPGDAIELTLAAYNAGPYAVLQHGGVPPLAETQAYVQSILSAAPDYLAKLGGSDDGLVPAAVHVRDVVSGTFGVTDFGGYATDGHIPGSDHYTGHAVDIMLTPMTHANTELGWRIALFLQSNARVLGVKYLIWQARIWSPDRAAEGWRPYRHPSGDTSPTALHLDHVHVSVN